MATVPIKYKLMLVGKTGDEKSCFGNFVLGRESSVTSSGLEVATDKEAADSVTVDEGTRLFLRLTNGKSCCCDGCNFSYMLNLTYMYIYVVN